MSSSEVDKVLKQIDDQSSQTLSQISVILNGISKFTKFTQEDKTKLEVQFSQIARQVADLNHSVLDSTQMYQVDLDAFVVSPEIISNEKICNIQMSVLMLSGLLCC